MKIFRSISTFLLLCTVFSYSPIAYSLEEKREGSTQTVVLSAEPINSQATIINNQGVRLFEEEKYEEAIAKFKEALKLAPDFTRARDNLVSSYNSLSVKLMRQGKMDKAIEFLTEALKEKPNYETAKKNLVMAFNNIGFDHYTQKNYGEAIKAFEKALQHDSTNLEIQKSLSLAYEKLPGNVQPEKIEAIIEFLVQQANFALEVGDFKLASYYLRKVLTLDPKNTKATQSLVIASALQDPQDQKKFDEAIQSLESMRPLDSNHGRLLAALYNNLGHFQKESGLLEEAIKTYRKAIRLEPRIETEYLISKNNLGSAILRKDRPSEEEIREAIQCFREVLALNQKIENSEADIAKVIKTAANNLVNLHIIRGLKLHDNYLSDKRDQGSRKKLVRAIDHFREAVQIASVIPKEYGIYPDKRITAEAFANLGSALQDAGAKAQGTQNLEKALEIDSTNSLARHRINEREPKEPSGPVPNPPGQTSKPGGQSPDTSPPKLLPEYFYPSIVLIEAGENGQKMGTGWIFKRDDKKAWILTCKHILIDSKTSASLNNITVKFYSEGNSSQHLSRSAKIIKMTEDDKLDLAVLEVDNIPIHIQPLELSQEEPRRQTSIYVTGHPIREGGTPSSQEDWNLNWTSVSGKIIAFNQGVLVVDATLAVGNSGGPVTDETNKVLGIVFEIAEDKDDTRGVGHAIPATTIIQQLKKWNFDIAISK